MSKWLGDRAVTVIGWYICPKSWRLCQRESGASALTAGRSVESDGSEPSGWSPTNSGSCEPELLLLYSRNRSRPRGRKGRNSPTWDSITSAERMRVASAQTPRSRYVDSPPPILRRCNCPTACQRSSAASLNAVISSQRRKRGDYRTHLSVTLKQVRLATCLGVSIGRQRRRRFGPRPRSWVIH